MASLRSRLAFHFQSGRDGGRSHASGMAQALGCARACASLVVPCVDPIAAEMARLGDTRASKSLRPMVLRALARATGALGFLPSGLLSTAPPCRLSQARVPASTCATPATLARILTPDSTMCSQARCCVTTWRRWQPRA